MLCLTVELREEGTGAAEERGGLWEGTADADVKEDEGGILPVLAEADGTFAAGLLRIEVMPK